MYLSEEKRAELRKCIRKQTHKEEADASRPVKGLYRTEENRKVSQILFDARDGKEVFTPF